VKVKQETEARLAEEASTGLRECSTCHVSLPLAKFSAKRRTCRCCVAQRSRTSAKRRAS
jgi:hypothetical protein